MVEHLLSFMSVEVSAVLCLRVLVALLEIFDFRIGHCMTVANQETCIQKPLDQPP